MRLVLFFIFSFISLFFHVFANSKTLDVEIIGSKTHPSIATENIEKLFQQLSAHLNRDFYANVFNEKNLKLANELAQLEDFDNQHLPLISPEMQALITSEAYDNYKPFQVMLSQAQNIISRLPIKERSKKVEQWRGIFLNRLGDYLRYLNSLKSPWSFASLSLVTFDSNLNRTPKSEPTPANHSGKSDLQFFSDFSIQWKPWINQTTRIQKQEFSIESHYSSILHEDFDENDLLMFSLEPKYGHHFGNYIDWAYFSFQSLILAKSRKPFKTGFQKHFHSHQLKANVKCLSSEPLFDWIRHSQINLKCAYLKKFHFLKENKNSDAQQRSFEMNQTLGYGQKSYKSIRLNFSYQDYQSKNSPASNHSTLRHHISHHHPLPFKILKKNLQLSEGLGLTKKKYPHFLGGKQTEQWLSYDLDLNIPINKSYTILFKSQYVDKKDNIETSILDPIHEEIRQYRISLGLSWRL